MNKAKIGIIDLGIGNINSVDKALRYIGCEVVVSRSEAELSSAEKLILPGVGSYNKAVDCMDNLDMRQVILTLATQKPILGICLGMQILSTTGEENGEHAGLKLIPGRVIKMQTEERIPHVGWNSITADRACALFNGIEDGACFYFTHSYHFEVDDKENAAAMTEYGLEFASAVYKDHIYGVQFHPEKSQDHGMALLKNFVNLC